MSEDAVAVALQSLDGWQHSGTALRRTIVSESFPAAMTLVQRVAQVAEHMDHHPDIDIRWRSVTYVCSTHSVGGVTELDVRLAAEINDLARPH